MVCRCAFCRLSWFPLKTPAAPSSRAFFHAWIWPGWTSYRAASWATVCSPFTASRATLTLNDGLCFLRRGVLNEQEFVKANNMARDQMSGLQERRESLAQWVDEQKERSEAKDRMPGLIKTFLEDFEAMDPRLRKSHLQTILKAAHISKDTIELEFRV